MCYASVCWFVVLLAFCNLNPEVHAELGENAGCGTISPHLYTLSYLVFTTCLARETIGDSGLCSCVISNTSILYEPLHTMFLLYIWFITKALKHCFTVWLYNRKKKKKKHTHTHTPNSPDIHTWLAKTHNKLTRRACRATQGQPWTSCCPCSSVATDTWSGSRASCWGRTASGSHTAGTSPMGTGAARTGWTRMAPSEREVNRTAWSNREVNKTAQSSREVYRTAGSDREVIITAQSKMEVNRTAQSDREVIITAQSKMQVNRTAQSDREVNKTAQSKREVNRTVQSDRYCTGRWMEQLDYGWVVTAQLLRRQDRCAVRKKYSLLT